MNVFQNFVNQPQSRFARRAANSRMLMTMMAGITTVTMLTACTAAGPMATSESASAAVGSSAAAVSDAAVVSAAVDTELFDSSVVHSISVEYVEADYDTMMATYVASGDKEWITATVTIDGTVLDNVGLKLKGNSSLRGLQNTSSADDPAALPWRIRLDKYVDGQNYKGQTDLVVRGNNSETSMNEAVALELLSGAGLPVEEAISSRFSVNGSAETLRLVIQNPSDTWYEENYDTDGILYKAEAGGDYSYRGEDPAAYTDVFDVEAATAGEDDYAPLISFLQFINESDDATFAAELGKHLDVQAFANYLAMQDLVANTDDIDGPGNNSYLHYDAGTGIFTVVPWDQNLSFGAMGGGPMGDGGGGGGGGGDRPAPPAGMGGTGADDPMAPADGAAAGGAPADGAAAGGAPADATGQGGPAGRVAVAVATFWPRGSRTMPTSTQCMNRPPQILRRPCTPAEMPRKSWIDGFRC